MELPTQSVIDLLAYLLPGFITAATIFSLTPAPKPIPFERVVQALIFTMIVQVLVVLTREGAFFVGRHVGTLASWTDDSQIVVSVGFGAGLGLLVAFLLNTDRLHFILRRLGLTRQTSYSSEWYGAFCQNQGYVVLHVSGNRRLYGWAEEWPSTPGQGHFVIVQAWWLAKGDQPAVELRDVAKVLVAAADVEMVEMMKPVTAETEEKNNGRS